MKRKDVVNEQPPCNASNGGHANPTVGDPIVLRTGANLQSAMDFETADGRLQLGRTYRSQESALKGSFSSYTFASHGDAGRFWRSNYFMKFEFHEYFEQSSTQYRSVTVSTPDLASFDINVLSGSDDPGYRLEFNGTPPPDIRSVITTGGQWNLTDPQGRVWLMEMYQGPDSTKYRFARPIQITSRDGYVQTLSYAAHGGLSQVSDSFGRQLTFTWNTALRGGQTVATALQSIALPDGGSVRYSYDNPPGDTVSSRLRAVERRDAGGSPVETTNLQYDNAAFPYALTGLVDSRGVLAATWTYDSSGRATAYSGPGGADQVTIAYSDTATHALRTVTNALGKQTTYKFRRVGWEKKLDGLSSVEGVASANCVASNSSYTYASTAAGAFIASETDEEGRVTAYTRDAQGRPTQVVRGAGTPSAATTTFTYHATLNVPLTMVEPGLTTAYTWNTSGQLTALTQTDTTTHSVPYATNGEVRTWSYGYGSGGRLTSVNGPLSGPYDTVTYGYNSAGQLTSVTNELGHETEVTAHNGRGQPTSITDANGVITALSYDGKGQLTEVTVEPGTGQAAETAFEYDAVGQVTKITRPDGASLTYTYSTARRLTRVEALDGESIAYTHDLMGNVTSRVVSKADSTITATQMQTFDELGRLLTQIGAGNQTTRYAYEKNGNLKSVTDPRTNVYSFAYDGLNRLMRETNEENAQVNYTRDGRDNIIGYADPRNLLTSSVRNGFGEVIRQTSPDSGVTDTVRDARGLATQVTDARGVVTTYSYDNAGRVVTKSYPSASAENVTYSYDATSGGNKGIGRRTGMTHPGGSIATTYDARGNVTAEVRTIAGIAHALSYSYGLSDKPTGVTYPSGRQVRYVRDAMGRITAVDTRATAGDAWVSVASSITYQPFSTQLATLGHGNGLAQTRSYTLNGELDGLTLKDGGVALLSRTHAWADGLNLTGISDAVAPGNTQAFAYSAANRLQSASGPWGSLGYSYDATGNRTQEIVTPAAGAPETRDTTLAADTNRIAGVTGSGAAARSFTHDATGNMLTDTRGGTAYAYSYNAAGRLASLQVGGVTRGSYVYDGNEQLITRTFSEPGLPAATVHTVHDARGNLVMEVDAATGARRDYLWLPEAGFAGTDLALAVIDAAPPAVGVLYHVHGDHLGRPVRITDAAKASVWDAMWTPWGAPHAITGTLAQTARFPGQWFQVESGLAYNWHRHYDPTLGRYTQPDPLGFVDGPSVYAYARGNPSKFVDPTGRNTIAVGASYGAVACGPACAAAGAAIGAVVLGVGYLCMASDDADPQEDALDQCRKAANGSGRQWQAFCQASQWMSPLPKDKSRPDRCRNVGYGSKQEKMNWCYNEFGS